jgi:hypothetical protein
VGNVVHRSFFTLCPLPASTVISESDILANNSKNFNGGITHTIFTLGILSIRAGRSGHRTSRVRFSYLHLLPRTLPKTPRVQFVLNSITDFWNIHPRPRHSGFLPTQTKEERRKHTSTAATPASTPASTFTASTPAASQVKSLVCP